MNDLENLNKFESNENNQIEFNEEDDDENKFIDENKIESNKENEEKFETRTCGMLRQIYTTKKDILNVVQEIAQHSGFAVTIKSSSHHHLYLQCKRGGQLQNTSNLTVDTRQKKRMSKCCECPYLLKALPKDSKWKVVEVINKHNHPKAKDARVFHEHCQLTQEAKCTAVQMLKAGAKPSTIYEAIRDENAEPIATRWNILNLKDNASMEALIVDMEKRGYSVRREDQKDGCIKHLFFCHENSVKMARHFPEVVLADATYKTNVYKLLFVNFVGISNLGVNRLQIFGIASAWISDESEKKQFDDNSYNEIIKIVDCIIHLKDYGALNLAITSYKVLADQVSMRMRMMKFKNKWVGLYTNRIMHLDATMTQCVEGAHSAMKHAIETSGSLTKSFNSLDRWIHLHYEKLSLQYENESVNIDPLLTWNDKNRLKLFLERVVQFALNKIKNELLNVTTYQACLFQVDSNYLMKDLSSTSFDNFSLKSRLYKIETRYINFLDEQQKSDLLSKLDGILEVPEVKLSEIKIPEQITGKEHPCSTKRLLIALENMEAKKKKKVGVVKKKPIENVNSSNSLLNGSVLNIEDQICNPKSDSNCRFRALAIAIRGNEENWNLVKLAMNGQLNKCIEVYKDWLGYNIDLLKRILESRASLCTSSLWFLSPDCAQLAADTFSVLIAIFDEKDEQCAMFFLLESVPIHRKNPI
ncbi:8387_t:CDS:2, partial [Cetraspora pellucida]